MKYVYIGWRLECAVWRPDLHHRPRRRRSSCSSSSSRANPCRPRQVLLSPSSTYYCSWKLVYEHERCSLFFCRKRMTSSFLVRRRLPSTEQGSTACGGVARVFDGDDSTWWSLNVFMNKRLKAVEMYVENSILFLSEKLWIMYKANCWPGDGSFFLLEAIYE